MDVVIEKFNEAFAKAFADLNYEWIEKAYTIEAHDREILDHPVEEIIEKGGQIFFTVVDGEAAGTVALIEMGGDAFELAKMAVSPGTSRPRPEQSAYGRVYRIFAGARQTPDHSRIKHKTGRGDQAVS